MRTSIPYRDLKILTDLYIVSKEDPDIELALAQDPADLSQ
jgi:hypothetical protein